MSANAGASPSGPLTTYRHFAPYLWIEDRRSGVLVPLQPNSFQHKLGAAIAEADRREEPFRAWVLKSRRFGCSTAVQSRFVHRCVTRKRYSTVTLAHEAEASAYLHAMSETMYDRLPDVLRRAVVKLRGQRGRRMEFSNESSMVVETAGDREAGRSRGARAVHASEVAFWPDAEKTLIALRQIVPREPGTIFVGESTANGVGNFFHGEWVRAQNHESGYLPIFAPWHDFLEYRLRVVGPLEDLDDEELRLVKAFGVTDEQLAWRRAVIRDECAGDLDRFHQEYPSSPDEAFLVSGRPYFQGLERLIAQTPYKTGDIGGMASRGKNTIKFEDNPNGQLRIYELPRTGTRYAIFGDPAGLITDDRYRSFTVNKHDASDYCCAQVLDLSNAHQVAEWHGRIDPDLFGDELARLGYLYHGERACAKISVEMSGGYGNATMSRLVRELAYPDPYVRRDVHGKRTEEETMRLGWATTELTRPLMLDSMRAMLREHPHVFKSAQLHGEMRTFIVNRRGKPEASGGCHDDRVMAMAGALELYREFALSRPIHLRGKERVKKPVAPNLVTDAPRV